MTSLFTLVDTVKSEKETRKMTKKEVYSYFGIVYENGKIFFPEFGFIRPLLINGNDKIGKGVYHFSTLPTNKEYTFTVNGKEYKLFGTCPLHCNGCYATKGNYRFQSCIKALGIRTYIAMHDIDFLVRAIVAQIIADNIKIVRLHASGDFFGNDYISAMRDIVKCSENTIFWTYTKNAQAENAFDDLGNINIVKSVIRGYGFNFGHCDYILKLYNALTAMGKTVYICRCGIDKSQHCVNCGACFTCDYVLFIEHSTEYNAEKDEAFPTIKALIESQKRIELKVA